ncbi:ATR-interacting protein-like isoform X2 [Montipora foliosa]|uniref:ATR-interacting protein-like isoform X2 n=1 Tax=Montipora foliosa TaxID=591990 RepID=UPI0035F1DFAD
MDCNHQSFLYHLNTMANFSNNNFLGNQKRRNFIYNPAVTVSKDRNYTSAQHVTSRRDVLLKTSVPSAANVNLEHGSPHKRFKSSHNQKPEEFAAADECRDLPVDAFDEELCALDDDEFDDDLLTAEQLDECDRIASIELQSHERGTNKLASSLKKEVEHVDVFENVVSSTFVAELDKQRSEDDNVDDDDYDDSLATHCTQDYAVSCNSTNATPSKASTYFNGIVEAPFIGSSVLQPPFVAHPQGNRGVIQPNRQVDLSGESLLDQYNGSTSFVPETNLDSERTNRTASFTSESKCLVVGDDRQMQSLRKEIEKLKSDYSTANAKVRTLEEEKFCRDGEIRILRDSLHHYETEEKNRHKEARAQEIQRVREQSQREKDLEKQVEKLTTQMQFKDREISQMIEKNRKRASCSTESCSPVQKRFVNQSEVFPTGNSFFQKTSPDSKVKSPRGLKVFDKDARILAKENLQKVSDKENSEKSALSGSLSGASVLGLSRFQQREAFAREREIAKHHPQSFPEIELVQSLLSPNDKQQNLLFEDFEDRGLADSSLISLLTLDTPSLSPHNSTQTSTIDETEPAHTMCLFDTQTNSKLKKSIDDVIQKDSSRSFVSNTVMLQTLNDLLECGHSDNVFLKNKEETLQSKFKQHHNLAAATNFLPLLESHIANYVDFRTGYNEENTTASCLTRNSPTPDSPTLSDSTGSESDVVKNLAALQDTTLISLRLLNILVLYSPDVCSCILKSARLFCETECNIEEKDREQKKQMHVFISREDKDSFCDHPLFHGLKVAIKKDSKEPLKRTKTKTERDEKSRREIIYDVQHSELLGYMIKLLVPQQKESMAVGYTTLQVLTSLARNCEMKYCTRLLPLLSDNVLSDFLSRDWCLTSLSLATALLTCLIRHREFVERLCSQSDDCILLKIYQGWLFRPDVPVIHYQDVHLQIVGFVNTLLSHSDSATLLFPLESECQCSLELVKCLVLMLDEVMNSVCHLQSDSLSLEDVNSSCCSRSR